VLTALAFGVQSLGPASEKADVLPKNLDYIRFFHKYFDYYKQTDNMADVAILRSFASMAYNNFTTHESTILFEQALIQAKIPFDIIFDEHLEDLGKYKVLVLANQESLSDEQCRLIREFVEGGGGVVATGLTSLFDDWRRRRPEFGLQDLFQAETPPVAMRGEVPERPEGVLLKNAIAEGRVVYISKVIPSMERKSDEFMRDDLWALPKNYQVLVEALRWAADDRFSVEVEAPLTVVAEFQQQKTPGRKLVHLVNYNIEQEPVIRNVKIDMFLPSGMEPSRIYQISSDTQEIHEISHRLSGNRVEIGPCEIETYSIVVVE
jgi:hypothetical protein